MICAIACSCVILHPSLHVGLFTHPRQLEDKVIDYGSLFYRLGSHTYTLDRSILTLISKIVVSYIIESSHQARATSKVRDSTENSILRSISVKGIKLRHSIREEVEYDKTSFGDSIES